MTKAPLLVRVLPLLVLLPLVIFLGINVGDWEMSLGEVWNAIFGADSLEKIVVRDLRLTRVLLAMVSGATLTLGGFLMQALVRNPLADPYIMGLSAGAGFGANLRLLGLIPIGLASGLWLPSFAFAGALLSLGLLLVLGYRSMQEDSARLLLAGIAVSSLFMAATGFLIYTASDGEDLRAVINWSFGSLVGADWTEVLICAVFMALLWLVSLGFARHLDVLSLGSRQAGSLGMGVGRFKLAILLVTALGVGGSIAYTGPIGFVGLMIPHFSRSLNGGKHAPNLVFGPLLGAVFLGLCDVLSQIVYPPAGLPIGIITAILGVPFFLYLLYVSSFKIG